MYEMQMHRVTDGEKKSHRNQSAPLFFPSLSLWTHSMYILNGTLRRSFSRAKLDRGAEFDNRGNFDGFPVLDKKKKHSGLRIIENKM